MRFKKAAPYLVAGLAGATAGYSFAEFANTAVNEPKNVMLSECQLDIALDNTLSGACSAVVIDFAMADGQLDRSVHTSPELEEFGGLESPGRLTIVVGGYKDELIDKLDENKVDTTAISIGTMIMGALAGAKIYWMIALNRRHNRPDPPPRYRDDLPEGQPHQLSDQALEDAVTKHVA